MIPTISASRLADLLGGVRDHRPPLYAAVAEAVRQLVADGRLPVGVRLPAERALSEAMGVSRSTVTAAYQRLADDGWLASRRGAGSWTRLPHAGPPAGAWVPAPADDGTLDLVHAAPTASPEVAAAVANAVAELPELLPTHGYFPDGLPSLRRTIAERYTRRGLPTTEADVVVTAGALQAAAAVVDLFVRPGDRVLVEHPSYPNVLDALRGASARIVPVALEDRDDGELVAAFARAARDTGARLAYLMPDFQNPTGRLLPSGARGRLAASLAAAGTTVLVDETFCELPLDGQPMPPPMAALAPRGSVITVGTTSKTFWGGLRVGWMRAEPDQARQLSVVLSRRNIGVGVLEQLAGAHLLQTPEATLEQRRRELARRRDVLVELVRSRLPGWQVNRPAGGLVLWARVPESSSALAATAARRGLRIAVGSRFGTGHAFDDRVRMPFTHPDDMLVRAVDVLAEASGVPASRGRPASEDREPLVV